MSTVWCVLFRHIPIGSLDDRESFASNLDQTNTKTYLLIPLNLQQAFSYGKKMKFPYPLLLYSSLLYLAFSKLCWCEQFQEFFWKSNLALYWALTQVLKVVMYLRSIFSFFRRCLRYRCVKDLLSICTNT